LTVIGVLTVVRDVWRKDFCLFLKCWVMAPSIFFIFGDSVVHNRILYVLSFHILGAAQVLVEDVEGKRIVFTGDFRIDETPVLDADVLVMEATYGSPSCKRSFGGNVRNLFVSVVEEGLKHGTVYVFGYHGKLQEVMQVLHNAEVKVPFVVPERVFHVSKVCERHGMRFGRLMLSRKEKQKSC